MSWAQATALQRAAGNRAVARLVQAKRDPSRAGPPASEAAVREAAAAGTRGSWAALPHLEAIQRSFGAAHDLSGVRAHIGGAAATASAAMGAQAYAVGERVAFAAAPSLRVAAHEAAHVIQQRRGVSLSGGVGRAGDRHEREADEAAERVVAGRSAAGLFGAHAGEAHAATRVQGAPAVQRLEIGQRPFSDGYAPLTGDDRWLLTAKQYEVRLGVYAYSHPAAERALDAALYRMEEVIRAAYDANDMDESQELALYREVFTRDDPGSAGQVGADLLLDHIGDVLGGGNLRERMTAFYNAAYYNSAPGQPPLRGLKQIALDALMLSETHETVEGANAGAERLGLDTVALGEMREFLRGYRRAGFKSATQLLDRLAGWTGSARRVGYNFADDPFALGNLALANELRGTLEMGSSQAGRVSRTDEERDGEKRTAEQYEELGVELSYLERAYTRRAMGGDLADDAYATTHLPWVEGHTAYEMSDDNSWVRSVRDKLRMPVVAGVSGTTARMLTAFKWLNTGVSPLDFRLALMGWMLPAWDHSLYEILRGSQLAGVRGAGEGVPDDVVRMYMNIPPLTTEELRAHVAEYKMFPHEHIYMANMRADESDAEGYKAVHARSNYYSQPSIRDDPRVSVAHATAIYGYTSGIHVLMNALVSAPVDYSVNGVGTPSLIRKQLMDRAHHLCRWLYLTRMPADTLPDEEQAELLKLGAPEKMDVFSKENRRAEWGGYCRDPARTSEEVDRYLRTEVDPWIDDIYLDVYKELKTHICMTVEGLSQLPAVDGMEVYRGDWSAMVGSRYEKGRTTTLPELTSFSKSPEKALEFASGGSMSYPVVIELALTGKGGRDISAFSKIVSEEEVLLLPGTRIRVGEVRWVQDGDVWYKAVTAEEV
ncbi:MAG: DUF4157 domain-containing protein [Myxococcales bacterium]|nr:DUF4157 domain-containing protein [Myxococcales bacterium]